MPGGVLVSYHCAANTGFAIGRLESVFLRMGLRLTGDPSRIFYSYTELSKLEVPQFQPPIGGVIRFDPRTRLRSELCRMRDFIETNQISTVMLFDQQPGLPVYRYLRQGGAKALIAYLGAPMSSLQPPLQLFLKKLQVSMLEGPDLYIFESESMRETGTLGRGIPFGKTRVVHLGVDPAEFCPSNGRTDYAHEAFGFPPDTSIILYSGHMEPRKGVAVLMRAAVALAEAGRTDMGFLLLGNRGDESDAYAAIYEGTPAEDLVRFGGYRTDIADIMRSASVGVIASTGWDSFTRSSVEMAASGLPLVVSRLQGLVETIEEGVTGLAFEPGNHTQLASILMGLVDDPHRRRRFGKAARERIVAHFSEEHQIDNLVAAIRSLD